MKKRIIILMVLGSLFLISCISNTRENNVPPNAMQGEQVMIKENAKKLKEIFPDFYAPEKKAILFAENLASVGAGKIMETRVIKQDEKVIVVALIDEYNHKYCATISARTGFVGVIYENELNGKVLYHLTDD